MKLESFTKKIFKSSLLLSVWVNVLTLLIIFWVSHSLIFSVYNSQYNKSNKYISNYINRISDNKENYKKINAFEIGRSTHSFDELHGIVTSKTSSWRAIKMYFEDIDRDPKEYLTDAEYSIYFNLENKKELQRSIQLHNKEIFIVDIKRFKKYIHMEFFNITSCNTLEDMFKNEGFLGYSYKDRYFSINDENDIESKSHPLIYKLINPKSIILESEILIPGFSFHISGKNEFLDNLTLFITIAFLSLFRIILTLINSRRNINKISKPLQDLVLNTEKLASHEVCEKLNRFDYPYMEFKKLAEAFNKVLLSRELSEIKLFRSFEQMESVVHKRTQELITANEQLTNAITKAEEANAAKSQFLANISHEIRTPLNCIIGFCDIILTDSDNEEITCQIGQILHESETLLHLINDFLDYSKIDAGKMTIVNNELNIRSLISSLLKSGKVQAGEKAITLEKEINSSVPPIIMSDELRLYQVISNIFYNAIKFTEVGTVKIKVNNYKSETKGKNKLEIKIIDTGIGIPEDRLDSIFDKFEQVDGSLTRNYRGSGLGLTICKKIAELMKGSIEVESTIGKGSIFTITIPVDYHEVSIEPLEYDIKPIEVKKEHIQGSKILLVEDYPVNQIVAKKHLEMDNHNVTIAENGLEAIKLCNKNRFDLILMDLQMPVMDGFKATKEIRSLINNRTTPILAMTANAMETAKQTCLDTGMNGVITKPIRKKVFLKEVDKWLKLGIKEEITPL